MSVYAATVLDRDAVPDVTEATVAETFAAVKAACEPDVLYDIRFDESDGMLFKRFARRLPVEAWMVALPVNDDGAPRRDKNTVVAPITFSLRTLRTDESRVSAAEMLRRELAALVEADS